MSTPFFTVIIPTFNRPDYLKEAVQSVLNQTFDKFEVIVVDDHSLTHTKKVVDAFQDNRILYILNDRSRGPGGARNSGMLKARGQWIAFLDDDDTWLPEKLELLYEKIQEADPETGLIYTGYASYDFSNKKEISYYVPQKKGWIQNELLYNNYIGSTSVVSVRADIPGVVGYMDEQLYKFEDGEFYIRIAGLFKIDFINKTLTYYRKFNENKLSLNYENTLNAYKLYLDKHKILINSSPRLRHRISSLIFIAALKQKKWIAVFEALPWTLAGLFFDLINFLRTMWGVLLILLQSIKKIFSMKKK
ncbi:glycosyltransferase family 2 protein [candidate division WS5 bacterium]|uniref:Glycosyltransferase family 2 protein n=1 Tax=candidate division WS5 bacterium TaxID=2093353 RepID=A0A419DBE7_9BACT|nr:MAG: glycosyltransferase family 2 protein [candidate division WS5 bacterium]